MSNESNGLFSGIGIELEYMAVEATELSVAPVVDELMRSLTGEYASEVERGDLAVSNELALHVVELKTNGPAAGTAGLAERFHAEVTDLNGRLKALGARLMPTAMHPWMDPRRETRLWPHEYNAVYEAFHRIFGCEGHGWSNLQSVHLNYPFADDFEFAALHAAVRLVLPVVPGLAASSPIVEGRATPHADNRLRFYCENAASVPSVTGHVIPERVYSRDEYEREILERIYADLAPHDSDGVLREEWVNARGAIARFQRNTIEMRLIDVQESPASDIAVAELITRVLRRLTEQAWSPRELQQGFAEGALERILESGIELGDEAVIRDPMFLEVFGFPSNSSCSMREFWQELCGRVFDKRPEPLDVILAMGTLSARIRKATGADPSKGRLRAVYTELCDCLAANRVFVP